MQNEDFIDELGFIGFTARVKRISDIIVYSARDHYKKRAIGIEPNWHLIFLLLKKEQELTVTQIASILKMSHPGVIKIVSAMKQRGFLTSVTDEMDGRKQYISLSEYAIEQLPQFEEEWRKIEIVIKQFVDKELLTSLALLEQKLVDHSFEERYDNISQEDL